MVAHATLPWGSRRRMGTAEDLRSRGASVFMQATAFMGRPSGSASLTTRAHARPLVRDHILVPAARATMSWHSQAKQPIMLRGRSVSAGVPDAPTRTFALDQPGQQAASTQQGEIEMLRWSVVDGLGQLSAAMWQARLVGTAAWRFGPTHTCVWVSAAGTVMLVSRVMGGDRVGGRWGGAYASTRGFNS
jgi:hypothetical protein